MRNLLGFCFFSAAGAAPVTSSDLLAATGHPPQEVPQGCEVVPGTSGSCSRSATLAEEGLEPGLSMLQRQARDRRQMAKKPWETLRFTAVAYHKSGVFLMQELQNFIFAPLGAPDSAIGVWQQPCFNKIIYNENWCRHQDAPIRTLVDIYGPDLEQIERAAAQPNGMRVAGSVRDPLAMIVSAYCYHHRGEELGYTTLWPPGLIMTMGPEEGLAFAAERMLATVQNMTAIFAKPAEDTIRLSFENFSASSEGFDWEVARLVNFWLGDILSDDERAKLLENAKQADLHRNRDKLASQSQPIASHSNNEDCEASALEAAKKLPPKLLDQYRMMQAQLGYSTGS